MGPAAAGRSGSGAPGQGVRAHRRPALPTPAPRRHCPGRRRPDGSFRVAREEDRGGFAPPHLSPGHRGEGCTDRGLPAVGALGPGALRAAPEPTSPARKGAERSGEPAGPDAVV